MNVERLSNAWLYPAIRQPFFSNSSMEGPWSVADEMVGERASAMTPIARVDVNGGIGVLPEVTLLRTKRAKFHVDLSDQPSHTH